MKKVLLVLISVLVLILASCAASNSGDESISLIAVGITFVLAVILIPTVSAAAKVRRDMNISRSQKSKVGKYLNDYEASHEDIFEAELKKAKLNPQKTITFGQNRLAADSIKKKLFVRSSKVIDGVLLGFEDVLSYELIIDGKVIGRPGGGIVDSTAAAGEDGIMCSDLRLVIKTKKVSDPEIVLPFIAFSIDSEFAYKEALGAAKEAAMVLDGIVR